MYQVFFTMENADLRVLRCENLISAIFAAGEGLDYAVRSRIIDPLGEVVATYTRGV
jgi:hypothetical protein